MMSKFFSLTASRDWFYRYSFAKAGLRAQSANLGDGTIMHCWVPKIIKSSKPNLLLLHGFGANAMWQYGQHLHIFTSRFNVYVPDLLFFGESYTSRPEITESFQAQCVMRLMEAHGVRRMNLVGISYGGFVGYSMASQFQENIEKVVLCCAGVCLEEKDMENGLFAVPNLDEAASILLPQTAEKLRELMRFSFVKPATGIPSFFLRDFIDASPSNHLCIIKFSGIFRRHVGESSQLVIIKNAGHAVNLEKAKEFAKYLKSFLIDSAAFPSPGSLTDFIHDKNEG
ncbi:ALPHA/BETA-HYDROLASES SUPERFAMILY PROTEIN [Salix viminalis]|uniref:ALPHA/BETA-HYDROLASES SUPERFAMILY PROTEIN n=2 Tax=Salix viminalis TaxID=40686 RepID=A0A9Q0ZK74_SALVM|nr:ALPHA/BETA-HYDROLASES SUPERFAMILY PROTEIN [Salix viminalis]